MEAGVSHNKQRLHKVGYFRDLLATNQNIDESIRPLASAEPRDDRHACRRPNLRWCALCERDSLLTDERRTADDHSWSRADHGVDLGAGDGRCVAVPSIRQAISYCGLCGDEKSSAEKVMRTPLSKQRNKHIQQCAGRSSKIGTAIAITIWLWSMKTKRRKVTRIGRRWR